MINNTVVTSVSIPETSKRSFFIYPNPANEYVHFSKKTNVEVTNVAGERLFIGEAEGLELSSYAKGIYFIRSSEGEVTKLVVK